MQEIKNKIRVAAAALAGGLMLGATMAGAFAANLSELPAPFVVNNNMAGQIVVGASATVPDVIAAAQISAALGQYMVSASSASGASTTREYKQEETAIDAVISTTLGTTLTDTAVSKLLDKQISFRSTNYDIHEAIILGGSTPLLVTGLDDSSMSSIRDADEYGSSVGAKAYLRVGESDIEYRYIFDDTLNGSATATLIDTDHPLKVNLMGQSISIVDIVDDDSITVQMGVTGSLGDGETIAVGDFVVTVETIATSSVALRVTGTGCASGGDSDFVSNGGTWDTACGGNVQVEVEDLLYVDADSPSNRVKLRVGEETTKTYNQGNNFLNEDEDDNDPGWKWTISATDGVINHVGAYYARSITSLEDEPITVGGSIALPYDYAVVKLVSYNTETRATYTLSFDGSEDLYAAATDSSPQENDVKVVILAGPSDDSFVFSGTESEKLAFYQEVLGTEEQLRIAFWDADEGKWDLNVEMLNVTTVAVFNDTGWDLTYQDTTYQIGIEGTGDEYNITLVDGASKDSILIVLHDDTTGFDWLGKTDNTAESSELWVGSEAIGTSETDVLTHYGAIISNPNSKGDSDKVTIAVPDEQVKVFAYVGPSGTVTATTSDVSYTYTGLTSEVAVLDSEATTTVPMIVVGGPYANSLARTLVGSDDAAIETFFGYDADAGTGKGIVKLYDSSETTWGVDAMLVAGWNSDDTRAAAYILGKYLSGSKSLSALSGKTKIAVTATDATTVTDETVE